MTIFGFFRYFWGIFGAPPWVGGFVFFSKFFSCFGFQGFLGSLPGPRDRNIHSIHRIHCAPPNLCLSRCVFRDCPCIWWSPSLGTRGPVDTQCICTFRPTDSLGRKGQIHCVSARPLVRGEGLYQIHGQSLNTHRGKHRSGGPWIHSLHSRE